MMKNYCWRASAIFSKITGAVAFLFLFFTNSPISAQTDCTVENIQGGIGRGTLSVFNALGNGMSFLVDPEGTGGADDPGCAVIAPYTYTINTVELNMGDASLFGNAGEGLGTFEYTVSIMDAATVNDTCYEMGTALWTSATLTEAMGDEGFHPASIPVGLEVTQAFFVMVTAVSWDGEPTRSPSVFLWDTGLQPYCRQYVSVDGTVTDMRDFFGAPFNEGWVNGVVTGSFIDSNPCIGAIFCDGFDAYTAGEYVGPQGGGAWTTWSDAPGTAEDAVVSDAQASSAPNSLLFENDSTSTDVVLPLGDLTSGAYEVSMKMYVPAGKDAYFNLLHQFDNVGGNYEWGVEVFFDGDGNGRTNATGVEETFTYTEDTWFDVLAKVDLNSDLARMYIDGMMVREWQWSLQAGNGNPGLNQLAAVNFYPAAGDDPMYYVDDVLFKEGEEIGCGIPAIVCDKFDSYTAGDYVAAQSGGLWTTWSDAPGTGEDAFVVDSVSYSAPNSLLLNLSSTDLVLPLGDLTEGTYEMGMKMHFPVGKGGYFNVMHLFDAAGGNYEWGVEVFFDGDGTGSTQAAGEVVDFTYTEGEWIDVMVVVNLDDTLAAVFIEGDMVRLWPWNLDAGNGNPGLNQLAVMDFYPAGADNPEYYVDNIYMRETVFAPECEELRLICDKYDTYELGALAPQAPHWSTWSGATGGDIDGIVTADNALSAPNSMLIGDNTVQDVLLLLGNRTTGKFTLELDCYVPAGRGGYFNVQEDETPAVAWNLEIWFNQDSLAPGIGNFADVNPDVTFEYPQEQWFHVRMDWDLDVDNMWFWANDVLVFDNYLYEGNIGSINYYSGDDNNFLYVDNVEFYANETVDIENELEKKDFVVFPNPNNGTFNIVGSDLTGTYVAQMIDITGRMVHSEVLNINGADQTEISVNGLKTGVYILRLVNQETNEIRTNRISIQ
jgi:hypothetical protein